MALESRNAGIDFRLLLRHTVPFGGEREKNEMAQTGRINLWYTKDEHDSSKSGGKTNVLASNEISCSVFHSELVHSQTIILCSNGLRTVKIALILLMYRTQLLRSG